MKGQRSQKRTQVRRPEFEVELTDANTIGDVERPLTITERRVLTFKASQILKSILNPDEPMPGKTDGAPAAATSGSPAPSSSRGAASNRTVVGQGERR